MFPHIHCVGGVEDVLAIEETADPFGTGLELDWTVDQQLLGKLLELFNNGCFNHRDEIQQYDQIEQKSIVESQLKSSFLLCTDASNKR